MRALKLIIKISVQKVMIEFGFGGKFHDLKYFEAGIFLILCVHYILEGIMTKICKKNQIQYNFIMFKHILNNYMINISTCTLLAPSSKLCKLLLKFVMSTKIAQLRGSMCFSNVCDLFLHKFQN